MKIYFNLIITDKYMNMLPYFIRSPVDRDVNVNKYNDINDL